MQRFKNKYRSCAHHTALMFAAAIFTAADAGAQNSEKSMNYPVRFITLDPGHFHAALIQKDMYEQVSPVVHVYAPEGAGLAAYLKLVTQYNNRPSAPTHWDEKVYSGAGYLDRMLEEKPGNVVVIAGNNRRKTEYISEAVKAGLNVLADKPMAIDARGFELLQSAFETARKNKVLLYDIMTERYEITNILQRALAQDPTVFGHLEKGSVGNPAVVKESVHHFYKNVSGSPLVRPAWYYDVTQEGEGIVDVTTHLVDLVQWCCFPDVALDYRKDIRMLTARRWPTHITLQQFQRSTGEATFPPFLLKDIKDSILDVYANGEMNYTIQGVHAKVAVTWNYQAPEGTGDTHYSIIRGSLANLVIRQGKEQQYKPVLYVEPIVNVTSKYETALQLATDRLQQICPGLSLKKTTAGWQMVIPPNLGHEEHFAQVTKKFLQYLLQGNMPVWEIPNMLAKYYTTTQAIALAYKAH